MSDPSPKSKLLACPHCGSSLKIRPEDRGTRRACASCGKGVAVPHLPSKGETKEQASPVEKRVGGKYPDVPVVCRLCGTRIYAFPSQIGKSIVCPDCTTANVVQTPVAKAERWHSATINDGDDLKLREDLDQPDPSSSRSFYMLCLRCGAQITAMVKQVGQQITCSDCGLVMKIPQPPKAKPKSQIELAAADVSVRSAEQVDLFKKNAETLLARAENEWLEKEQAQSREPSYGAIEPPKRPFDDGVFSFPFRLEILPLTLTMAVLACAFTVLAHGAYTAEGWEMFLGLLMMAGAGIFWVVFVMLASASCLNILEETSRCVDHTMAMPPFEMIGWFWSGLYLVSSAVVCLFPGFLLNFVIPGASVGLALPALFIGYPFFLLSMLEANSPGVPYSAEIHRSLVVARPAWIKFYLRAALLVLVICVPFGLIWFFNAAPITLLVLACTASTCAIIYARLLGRLTWVIGNELNVEDEDEESDLDSGVKDSREADPVQPSVTSDLLG